MLTDITFLDWETFDAETNDPEKVDKRDYWERLLSPDATAKRRVRRGVYHGYNMGSRMRSWCASHDVVHEFEFEGEDRPWQELAKLPSWTGVADDVDQILSHLDLYVGDPDRTFVIAVQHSVRSEMEGRTWRWRKQGPYIGEQERLAEYFYDEPEIEEVWGFHMYEVTPRGEETA